MATHSHSRFADFTHHTPSALSIKNLKEEILCSRFWVVNFDKSITTNLTTKRWVTEQKLPTNMTSITTNKIQSTMLCLEKIITTVVAGFLPNKPFLKDSFTKFGTAISYSEMLRAFVILYRKYVNNITKNLLIYGFSGAKTCLWYNYEE